MTRIFHFDYSQLPDDVCPIEISTAIRDDISEAYRDYWKALASPGNWWSGVERIAIAAEVRAAQSCEYCDQRKQALSPSALAGVHSCSTHYPGVLDEAAVDAIHRIVKDQTRITQTYVDALTEAGISNECYVELAGIVVTVFSIDEFNRALGLPWEPLPLPEVGEVDNYRPQAAEREVGFVPMVSADAAAEAEQDLYPDGRSANVLKALSLVPNAVRQWMSIAAVQYLSIEGMANLIKQDGRSLNRMQMELIAGRVSAINQCFY